MQISTDRSLVHGYRPIMAQRPANTPDARQMLELTAPGASFGSVLKAQLPPEKAQITPPQAVPAPALPEANPQTLDPALALSATLSLDKPADDAPTLSATAPTPPPPAPPRFSVDDFRQFLTAFNSSSGAQKFDERWDLNSDGSIDTADLSVMLANMQTPRA